MESGIMVLEKHAGLRAMLGSPVFQVTEAKNEQGRVAFELEGRDVVVCGLSCMDGETKSVALTALVLVLEGSIFLKCAFNSFPFRPSPHRAL